MKSLQVISITAVGDAISTTYENLKLEFMPAEARTILQRDVTAGAADIIHLLTFLCLT